MSSLETCAARAAQTAVSAALTGETTLRLVGPSIHAVCVALRTLDGGRALAESFPRMRLSAANEPAGLGPTVRVSAGHGTVRLVIEAATEAISGAMLSRDLGCSLLLTRRITGLHTRHAALFDRGRVVWEERIRAAAEPGTYRLSCPPLGIQLSVPLELAEGDAVTAAWRTIHAHVEAALGPETTRLLVREDLGRP